MTGSIRLIGGSVLWEGRVEVCKSDTWGTICDDMWNEEDSNVACRQLGYSSQGKIVVHSPQCKYRGTWSAYKD